MAARDYKRSRARRAPFSGWTGLGLGAAAGLAVAVAVFLLNRPGGGEQPAHPPEPASAEDAGPAATEPVERYDFYEMLPKFEVVVPEREAALPRGAPPAATEPAGAYVLQVGSYRNFAEADRVRAQLALQGIESRVQRVSVDNDTWHRVRVGPIADLDELSRIRDRLREAEMDTLVIRVGD
jgi:cell division protein FtsN